MAFPAIRGKGIGMNLNNIPQINANKIQLAGGQTYLIPAGTYMVSLGLYTTLQYLDPVMNQWVDWSLAPGEMATIDADGGNFRLANLTGCPIGAVVSSGGAATYTSTTAVNGIGQTATGITVTVGAGGSKWVPVVGGAVSKTLTSGTVGAGYNFPPTITISPPPAGGLPALATCTLTSGAISVSGSNVTITNQGAGYTTPPTITFIPDPREATQTAPGPTTTAVMTLTLTGSNTVTGLYPSDPGNAVTTAPALTFSPTGASATAIMNFTVTAVSVSGGVGGGIGTGTASIVTSNHISTVQGALSNPFYNTGLTGATTYTGGMAIPRPARITANIAANTLSSASGFIIEDAGYAIQSSAANGNVFANYVMSSGGASANAPAVVLTFGATTDVSYLQPF